MSDVIRVDRFSNPDNARFRIVQQGESLFWLQEWRNYAPKKSTADPVWQWRYLGFPHRLYVDTVSQMKRIVENEKTYFERVIDQFNQVGEPLE